MANSQKQLFFYSPEGLALVKHSDSGGSFLMRATGCAMAQRVGCQVVLYGSDIQGSIVQCVGDEALRYTQYTPYGYNGHRPFDSVLQFNGQRKDPSIGRYFLGDGYRIFSPSSMRFNSPDSSSPFDKGGLNAYSYCGSDPINRIDPSGRSWIDVSFLKALFLPRVRRSKTPVLAKTRPIQGHPSLEQKIVNDFMDNRLTKLNQRIAATKTEVKIRGFITEQYGEKFGYTVHRLSEGLPVMDPDLELNIEAVSRHAAVYRSRAQENPSELNIEMATKFADADKYLQSLQKQIRS